MSGSVMSGSGSVASAMAVSAVMGKSSALYSEYTEALAAEVRRLAAEKLAARAVASVVVLPQALSSEDEARLVALYPESRVVCTHMRRTVQPAFEAERTLVLEWARNYAKTMASNVVMLGDGYLNVVLHGDRRTHVEYSEADPVAVHQDFGAVTDFVRFANAAPEFRERYGVGIEKVWYEEFLQKKAFVPCTRGNLCGNRGGVFIGDLSMYPMSQRQFAMAMESAGASVGVALVPYNPVMLMNPVGDLPGVDVGYECGSEYTYFHYYGGLAGAVRFRADAWHEWLGRSVAQTELSGYSIERRQVRGNFMCVVVTKVARLPAVDPDLVTHALELPGSEGKVVIECDELVSVTADPKLASSWRRVPRVYDERIVKNVYAHALSLSKEEFSKNGMAHVLKRVFTGDNRATFGGGYVNVQAPLSTADAHGLATRIFSRAFVDRYEMGTLTAELMKELAAASWFAEASVPVRVALLMGYFVRRLWDSTGGKVIDALRKCLFAVRQYFERGPKLRAPVFEPMARFVSYHEYALRAGKRWVKAWFGAPASEAVVPGVRGSVAMRRAGCDPRGVSAKPDLKWFAEEDKTATVKGDILEVYVDTREPGVTDAGRQFVAASALVDTLAGAGDHDRFIHLRPVEPAVVEHDPFPEAYQHDPSYVSTINDEHETCFPGMAQQEFQQDASSLRFDPQDRSFDVNYLRIPVVAPPASSDTEVYKSKVSAYRVERRDQNLPEMLSALSARTMAAPVIAEPQDMGMMVEDVWDVFLDTMCVPDARERVVAYESDPVGFEEDVLRQWSTKARPEILEGLRADLESRGRSVEQVPLHEYMIMLKSDAKPPMSTKPLHEQVAPQVIAFQQKYASALYSSLLRVIARRFLALLKPNVSLNLLKDVKEVGEFFERWYPWDSDERVWCLENDFSKYDKSQGEFATFLKGFVYGKLGFSKGLLDRWMMAQSKAVLVSLALGIRLHVENQQKSGDGGTSLANGIVNIMSVAYAYKGTKVIAAVFVGDDSAVLAQKSGIVATERSVRVLAEVFNLQAKFFVSEYIYFGSHHFNVLPDRRQIVGIPDPVKRAERLSVSVNARSATGDVWRQKYEGYRRDCEVYMQGEAWAGVEPAVMAKYTFPGPEHVTRLINALATVGSSFEAYRGVWEEDPTLIHRG